MHSRLWAHSPLSLSHTLNSVCPADRERAIWRSRRSCVGFRGVWGSRCERWPGASECVSTPTRGYAYVPQVRTSRVQCMRVGPSRAGSGESASEADCARATANAATAAPPGRQPRVFSHGDVLAAHRTSSRPGRFIVRARASSERGGAGLTSLARSAL